MKKILSIFLMGFLVLSLFSISQPQHAYATSLGHTFVEQTTRQTSTSTTYTDISGANIASGNFTVGKKYLLVFTGQMDGSSTAQDNFVKAIHGSTDFEGSEFAFEPDDASLRTAYFWFTVWTAVSGEAVKLQFKGEVSNTVGIDQITMVAIKLSDDLTENTDWFFNENTTNATIQSLYGDDNSTGSVTFTPNGTDDWLVLATSQLDPDSVSLEFQTRINAGGGVTDTGVEWIVEGEDSTNDLMVQTLAKVYTPTSTSTTFETETQRESADGGTKLYNSIFALNLNKLAVHAFQATQAEINLDTTNSFTTSTNIANATITPTVTGDVWNLGFGIYDANSLEETIKFRMQIDDADQPPTQTSDNANQQRAWDTTDELPFATQTIENLNTTSHSLKFNATKSTTARAVEDRLAMMLTMELVSAVNNTSTKNDNMSMTDDITIHVSKAFNDTMSLPDDTTIHLSKAFNDTMSMPDDITTDVTKAFNDTMSMPDDTTIHHSKAFNDTMSLPDNATATKMKLVTKDDPMSMTDDITTHITKAFNDTMSLPDDITTDITKVFNDTMSLPDSVVVRKVKVENDEMSMTDDIVTHITKAFNDTMSLPDDITTDVTKFFNDTMSLPDSMNATKSTLVTKDDPMSMTDDITTHVTKTFNDPMSIPDTEFDSHASTRSFNDPMSLPDNMNTRIHFFTPPPEEEPIPIGGGSPSPTLPDSDHDGIPDIDDQCDLQPEDYDNFEDADGCPEGEFVQPPPEGIQVPDITNFIPFEFDQLDVIDDYIKLDTKSPQPQVETLSIRWLGAKPITISSVQLAQSPFEIQLRDIPVVFGNNQFGFTETQILYTVQEPDKICTNQITFDCLDKITYQIPVIVTGELDGKTIIADGTITIDNSDRLNPYWLIILAVLLIPLIAILFHKHRKHKREPSTFDKLRLTTSNAVFKRAVPLKTESPQKAGTTRSKLTEESRVAVNITKKDVESKPTKFKSIEEKEKRNIFGRKSKK